MAADGASSNLGNNTHWTFGAVVISPSVSQASGNWYAASTWGNGNVPTAISTATILSPHVVTATAPVTVSSVNVNSGGILQFDGSGQVVTFTMKSGGKLINNGSVVVLSSANAVTLQGESGGSMTFEGTDIDYNAKKIYLARLMYRPAMSLSSGETVELSGNVTMGNSLITASGASFVVGNNNSLTLTGDTTLANGTFTRGTGTSQVKLNGNFFLNSGNNNLGNVVTGP
jgi:hypothetical protein